MDLVKRMKATQRTVDKFKGRVFRDWQTDCILLISTHARHMGHPIKVPKYKDRKSAAAVMKRLGFKNLADATDAHFTRIAPSAVLLADIVEMPGGNGFSALTIALGNGRVLGFHEDVPFADVLQPLMISGAWRID